MKTITFNDGLESREKRFHEGVALEVSKFVNSPNGQVAVTLLREAEPDTKCNSSLEETAISGAKSQGWRECLEYLLRLSTYNKPKPDAQNTATLREIGK